MPIEFNASRGLTALPAESARNFTSTASTPTENAKLEPTFGSQISDGNDRSIDPGVLEQSVAAVQEHVQAIRRHINFEIDESSGRTLVQVIDPESGDVIRQLPSESVVATAAALAEFASSGTERITLGLLLQEKV